MIPRPFQLISSRSQHLADVNLKHGDMIFLKPSGESASDLAVPSTSALPLQPKPSSSSLSTVSSSSSINSMVGVPGPSSATPSNANINKKVYDYQEDEVDLALYKIDGRIKRQRDPKL